MFKSPTRNHFSVVIERLAGLFAFLFVFLFSFLRDYGWDIFRPSFYRALIFNAQFYNDKILYGFIAFSIFFLWYLFICWRYWKKTTFRIDGTDFVHEKKTLFSSQSRLPIENIAVVNVERNFFERIIGTAKVKIDLNSSRTAGATDFKFVLKHDEALQLKEVLTRIKQTVAPSVSDIDVSDRTTVASFSNRQAVITKLLSFPILQVLSAVLFFFVLPQFETSGNADMSKLWYWLLIAMLGYFGSLIPGTLNLCNYLVEKKEDMIFISCGMINKRNYVFETDKINAVIINQPVLARFFGMQSIDLAVVGLGNEKNETTHISLMVKETQAKEILSLCAPDFECSEPLRKCHPLVMLFPIIRSFVLGAAALLLKPVYTNYLQIAILVFAVSAFAAVCQYRVCTFAADNEILTYSTGIFNKKTFFFKFGDIQNINLRTNALYRKKNLGRVAFSILAASAVRDHKTGLFVFDDFDTLSNSVTSHKDNLSLRKFGKRTTK